MAKYMLKLPSMGESVTEATLTAWLKEVGDTIEQDESVVEVATDKVDSDIPSEFQGVLIEKCFNANDVVQVDQVIAIIETDQLSEDNNSEEIALETPAVDLPEDIIDAVESPVFVPKEIVGQEGSKNTPNEGASERFYSPLVKSIAKAEGVTTEELEQIPGTGENNRVTKKDILAYIAKATANPTQPEPLKTPPVTPPVKPKVDPIPSASSQVISTPAAQDQVIEMTRMGKLISEHMSMSKNTSVHVQTFVEADVTDLWDWRESVKQSFIDREGEKLTFTPIFISAVIHALKKFPLLNSSVEGDKIIQKRDINIGMATALNDGNLIVPVIKNTDHLNLVGIAKAVNDISERARSNQLLPDEVQNGTYTVTNIGNFGSLTGTPIINQPQVGILALGAIRKMPAVIETTDGDFVGIRKKMILSHSYDHRIINGAMGGQFVKAVADFLEQWDTSITFNQ